MNEDVYVEVVADVEENLKPHVPESGMLDMVIAFDTTGSMSAYIEDVKKHVKELIPELLNTNPDLMLSIVATGDYCDMVSPTEFGNAYQVIELTRDGNALIDFTLNAENTGGGDLDEFYELVLHKILTETKWREGAKKSILLIADAQPHPIGYTYGEYCQGNQIDWRQDAELAKSMGVEIDTLSLSFYGEDWYKELSEITDGVYSQFKTSGKTTDFVKAATYARGGEATASLLNSMALCADAEISSVASNYYCKNLTAKANADKMMI